MGTYLQIFSNQITADSFFLIPHICKILNFYRLLIVYPILGYFLGHVYPSSPTFGLPCPTTVFTFGLLLLNGKKCPLAILIIPFTWSIIGFMAAFQFGIVEDTGLLVAGLSAASLLIYRNRMLSKKEASIL
ncbi:DUF6064 family protein [Haliscomenobacter sp.]|uniref:DUF6064 family protein n=1 Tax=Haliscomenobacter sp. TaxID=2717303 RepID=UPI003593467C